MFAKIVLSLSAAFVALTFAPQEPDLTGIKCVINGKKAATAKSFVEYKKGKIYFCCDQCAESFAEDAKLKEKAKFAVKANHQLVLTGQFKQKGCPFSGGPIDENLVTKVGGTKVGFCCEGCQKKVTDLEKLEDKVNLVFSQAAFKKGFELKQPEVDLTGVKCLMMKDKDVSAEHAVDYRDGKAYFCCGNCAKKFAADKDTYSVAANQQLVVTKQFKQTACPISGGGVDDDEVSTVGGVSIKFCCDKCKGKVDSAPDEESKAKLVFGKRFEKAFTKQ